MQPEDFYEQCPIGVCILRRQRQKTDVLYVNPALARTNGVDAGSFSVLLADGESYCSRDQFIPADADRLRMTIGSYGRPMPPIKLVIVTPADGRVLTDRLVPAAPKEGAVALPPSWKKLTLTGIHRGGKRYTLTVTPQGRTLTPE